METLPRNFVRNDVILIQICPRVHTSQSDDATKTSWWFENALTLIEKSHSYGTRFLTQSTSSKWKGMQPHSVK